MKKQQATAIKAEADELGYEQIVTMQATYMDGSRGWEVIAPDRVHGSRRIKRLSEWEAYKQDYPRR